MPTTIKSKKGVSPKPPPTYNALKEQKTVSEKYVCSVCGYTYDPERGDPEAGIAPGTAFADLPDDWVCPICGTPKSDFEKA